MKSTNTKKMSKRIFISSACLCFLIACCCISCKETVSESLRIIIQNRTDSIIDIRLFPNDKYIEHAGDGLYMVSELGVGGGMHDTEYSLSPNEGHFSFEGSIFYTDDINIEPYTLATKVFDSIYISTENKDRVLIKFTHENVSGYTENIFSENSTWSYKVMPSDKYGFRVRKVNNCYTFIILKDKIIIE